MNGARGGRDVVACDLWVFAECKLGMSGVLTYGFFLHGVQYIVRYA